MTDGLVTYYAHEESPLLLVDCTDSTMMRATGPIAHRCPYVDEVDRGEVTITWTTAGRTFELHSLREYLDTYRESPLSHEAVAALIYRDLIDIRGIGQVSVSLDFSTAGFACHVDALAED